MSSSISESQEAHKRKRNADDTGSQASHPSDRIPQPPPPTQPGPTRINYYLHQNAGKIELIQGGSEAFSHVLNLISNYEGVLSRHESLAASLGAKLAGPRLVRAMETAFEGPIITRPPQPALGVGAVTWLDIVYFAKAHPEKFLLTSNPEGERYSQFHINGVQVQIIEDDWRLIRSGALDRFSVVSSDIPLEEDETAELATLSILESRLQTVIKKADEVARRARQLNYHFSGRKAAIRARRSEEAAISHGAESGHATPGYDLKADLLQQFQSPTSSSSFHNNLTSRASLMGAGAHDTASASHPPSQCSTDLHEPRYGTQSNNLSPLPSATTTMPHREPPDPSAAHRSIILSRIDKLGKGDEIFPPCDRCRRLRSPCIKHLTACQGCTKKHAKCAWKHIPADELARLEREGSHVGDSAPEAEAATRSEYPQSGRLRYDPTQDEGRHSADESFGSPRSRGPASRPGSRGSHSVRPLSPSDPGLTASRRHSGQLSHTPVIESFRGTPRHWEHDMDYRGAEGQRHHQLHPPDHSMLSHLATAATASATDHGHDARLNHVPPNAGH